MRNLPFPLPSGHNPFGALPRRPFDLTEYQINGMLIQRASGLDDRLEAIYYRTPFTEYPQIVVYFRVPGSAAWLLRPVTMMSNKLFEKVVANVKTLEQIRDYRDRSSLLKMKSFNMN